MSQPCDKILFLQKMVTMKNLKAIRKQLGLSQHQMAYYLKLSRTQLAMTENGKRDLPLQALVKLAEMELFLNNLIHAPQPEPMLHEAAQLDKATAMLAQHQKELEYQQLVLQRKLDKMQNAYQYNCQLLQFATHLADKNTNANTVEKSWLQMIKTMANRNIEANGLHHQAKIKLNLQMHTPHVSIDFIENLTKTNEN